MNPKEPSFIAQHIEKIVLGVAALIAVAALAYFLLGDPFTGEIDGRTVRPGEVAGIVEQRVQRLESAIDQSAESHVPEDRQPPRYSERFRAELSTLNRTPPVPEFVGRPGIKPEDWEIPQVELPTLEVPTPPMPDDVTATGGYAVFDYEGTGDAEQRAAVVDLIGDQQPRDFRYVTVTGEFPMDEWVRLIRAAPKDRQIPENIWAKRLFLTAVELQRQELLAPGQWGEVQTVEPLPGQLSWAVVEDVEWDAATASQNAREVAADQYSVTRPEFPNAVRGEGPHLGPPAGAAPAGTDRGPAAVRRQPAGVGLGDEFGGARLPEEGGAIGPIDVPVWQQPVPIRLHDLTVKAGKTYRYRVVPYILNPVFQLKNLQEEQVEQLSSKFALRPTQAAINDSGWTQPVEIPLGRRHYFVAADAKKAVVEAWRVFDGRWVSQQFDVRPGDPLGGTRMLQPVEGPAVSVAMTADELLVDIELTGRQASPSVKLLVQPTNAGPIVSRQLAADKAAAEAFRAEVAPGPAVDEGPGPGSDEFDEGFDPRRLEGRRRFEDRRREDMRDIDEGI